MRRLYRSLRGTGIGTPRPRLGVLLFVAGGLVLALPSVAMADALGVVPILIGPMAALAAIIPAMLVALGGALLAMLKPRAIKAGLKMMWRNKLGTLVTIGCIVGAVYLVRLVAGLGGAKASAAEAGSDWPAMRGGPERSGWSGDGDDPVRGGVIWSYKKANFVSSPAVVGNRVYIATYELTVLGQSGSILCLDADNGAVVWENAPKDYRPTYSSPSVAGKYLVVGEGLHKTSDARINCLDAATGKVLWEQRTASHVESSPCIANGKAYIGAGDDGLWCIALEPKDGKPDVLWHLSGQEYPDCETSPIVHDGKLYFGMGDLGQAVACVNAETGQEIWRMPTPYPVFSSPLLSDGKLFVAMGNGDLVFNAETHFENLIKAGKMSQRGWDDAKIAEARKQLAHPAGEVWCLSPETGKRLWSLALPETVLGVIAAADKRLYFGSQDGVFHCLTTDGDKVYDRDLHEPLVTSAAVGKEHVYFLTGTGRLFGLDRVRNRVVWRFAAGNGGMFLSSPALARGHIYVGTESNGLLCLGVPRDEEYVPVWGGYLGGPGQSGWSDGSFLPRVGTLDWRWPRDVPADQPLSIRAPAAVMKDALYVGIESARRTGLVKLALIPKEATTTSAPASATSGRASRQPKHLPYEEKWFFPTILAPRTSAAIARDRVYVSDGQQGQSGRSLYCLDAQDARELWKLPVDPQATGQYLLTTDRLYAFTTADALSCLGVLGDQAGKVLWSVKTGATTGMPSVVGDVVLVSSQSQKAVLAIDLRTRTVRWASHIATNHDVGGADDELDVPTVGPVANEDVVAVGTRRGLVGYSIVNGARLWKVDAGAVVSPIVCDENRLLCTTAEGQLLAVDWAGKEICRLDGANPDVPPMLCGDQVLYYKDNSKAKTTSQIEAAEESLQCVDFTPDRKTGQVVPKETRWEATEYLGGVSASPVMLDSQVYFPSREKGLVCLKARK